MIQQLTVLEEASISMEQSNELKSHTTTQEKHLEDTKEEEDSDPPLHVRMRSE
jgi:hypothetical protein